MYKEFTAVEWRKLLKLPEDYTVSGMLIYGSWNKEKNFEMLKKSLIQQSIKFEIQRLPSFLGELLEFIVEGKKYWFAVSYGGALLSEYLHLACLFGSNKNILIGTCGGLFDQLATGDFIIPTFAHGNESTTRLYQRDVVDHKHFPSQLLSDSLVKKIDSHYTIHRGPTITCQAMMGETLADIKDWSMNGYYGVEMEAATVIAVSNHFTIPASALLLVSDNLIKGEAVGGEEYESARAFREGAKEEQYRVAISELLE